MRDTAILPNVKIEAAGMQRGGGTMVIVYFLFFSCVLCCVCGAKPLVLSPPLVKTYIRRV